MGFSEILSLWPDLGGLAADLGRPYDTVAAWKRRGSVPVVYWDGIVASARKRRLPVSAAMLFEAARAERKPEPAGAE